MMDLGKQTIHVSDFIGFWRFLQIMGISFILRGIVTFVISSAYKSIGNKVDEKNPLGRNKHKVLP